jgi:hypothetical protein
MLNDSVLFNNSLLNMTAVQDCTKYCAECMRAGMGSMVISHFVVMIALILIFTSQYMKNENRKEFMHNVGMIAIGVCSLFWVFGPISI